MLNHLRDLVKHTSSLGVAIIKLTGDEDGSIKIEGMDIDKSVVIKGKFLKQLPELAGVCGLGNLDWLSGFVNIYQEKNDTVKIVRNKRTFPVEVKDDGGTTVVDENGNIKYEKVEENVLEEIHFTRATPKMKSSYRVVDKRQIPEQYSFLGANWDVVIEPSKQSIDLLSQLAGVGFETFFGVKTEDRVLYLTFGDNEQAELEFAQDVDGELTKPWIWDISKVLSILKFSDSAECKMSFLDKGALQITLNTGIGEYNYIMPAKAR